MDRHITEQMEAVLSRLSLPVQITEMDRLDRDLASFAAELVEGLPSERNGQLFLRVHQPQVLLSCSDSSGANDVLILAEALIGSVSAMDRHVDNCFDVYRKALLGEIAGEELESLRQEHQIPQQLHHCVLLIRLPAASRGKAFELLRYIIPMTDSDSLIELDNRSVALIKDMSVCDSVDDVTEYADALQETLMSEIALQTMIGIGSARQTLAGLRVSYLEAQKALTIARAFFPEKTTCAYERMMLQRLLLELPPETAAQYHALLFNSRSSRLFSEEMMHTIDVFFRQDLNLSDAARQLFIHRNTLVYRLDKIQKQTGLDLRSFDDAVTFRVLMELKKNTTPSDRA